MKQALLKSAFLLVVLLFGMILMVPVSLALDGYRGDRLLLGGYSLSTKQRVSMDSQPDRAGSPLHHREDLQA
jgi:hypothetical protein